MSAENKKTILLVEDEVVIAMVEKFTLEKFGYDVITANTGEEAVDTVEKTPSIDLILMDIELGTGMDGTEAAEIILRERDLPVVFLSSHTEPEVVEKTEKITSYGYIVKNSSITVLDASIKMAFKLFESIINEKEKESRMEAALRALQESEQRLNFHVNNSPLATIEWTTDFIVTRWSVEAERIFGWNQSETIGKPMMDLQMIYNEDIPLVRKTMDRLSDGSSKRVVSTNRNYTKEGKVIICEWYNSVLLDAQGKMISLMSQAQDITERKRVESQREAALEALRESEERYRTLIENASDLVYRTDKAGHFTFINRAALTTTGYEERELIGKSYPTLIRPDMRNMVVKIFLHQIRKGTHNTYSEFPILTKDGREIWLGQNIQLIVEDGQVTGFQAVSRDITERKQAEASFKQALNWQQTIFEGSRDAIFISDQDSRFVAVNNAACDLTGYSHEQLLKMRIPDIHDLPDLDAYKMYHQRIFGGEEILSEAKIQRSDSAKIDIEFNNRCVSIAGKLYMHTTARNIDDRKQAEAEIKRQLAEKETLLKEVHHRIKNNIASVGSLLSLHSQSTANHEAIAVLQDAIGRVNSMRILYDKLLLSEDYKDISVKNYLDDLIDTVIAIFPNQAKITLEKRIADFHLDSKRLFPLGIITNELLTNKMKYAFINRDTGLIKISLTNVDNHVTLTIQDNGIGLPAGFDINESKGFGLKLVKMLSQQLGGNFSIENQAGNRCMIEFNI